LPISLLTQSGVRTFLRLARVVPGFKPELLVAKPAIVQLTGYVYYIGGMSRNFVLVAVSAS